MTASRRTSHPTARQNCLLILFVRAPQLGHVKTRLAAALGPHRALSIYRELGATVMAAARTAAARAAACRLRIAFTPPDGEALVRNWLGADSELMRQGPGDLGARLAAATRDAFAAGAERVLVIGSDCPAVTAAVIDQAFDSLEHADVVIGPASDGGYYLIGLARPAPELFVGIPWSSPDTCRVTLAAADRAGLRVVLLEELFDVDTAADWQRWCALAEHADARRATMADTHLV